MKPEPKTATAPTFSLTAGRCINRDGKPFVTVHGVNPPGMHYSPAEVDAFAKELVRAVNSHADFVAALQSVITQADGDLSDAEFRAYVSQLSSKAIGKAGV